MRASDACGASRRVRPSACAYYRRDAAVDELPLDFSLTITLTLALTLTLQVRTIGVMQLMSSALISPESIRPLEYASPTRASSASSCWKKVSHW